jgi:hypothetical protein
MGSRSAASCLIRCPRHCQPTSLSNGTTSRYVLTIAAHSCCSLDVIRIGDWKDKTFIDSQSDAAVGRFYFAVALYALLLISNTLAIINQIFLFIKVVRRRPCPRACTELV